LVAQPPTNFLNIARAIDRGRGRGREREREREELIYDRTGN
jgi:hypothetical protein